MSPIHVAHITQHSYTEVILHFTYTHTSHNFITFFKCGGYSLLVTTSHLVFPMGSFPTKKYNIKALPNHGFNAPTNLQKEKVLCTWVCIPSVLEIGDWRVLAKPVKTYLHERTPSAK